MKRDERFEQLLALADEGDECARADLFKEYEVIHGVDGPPRREPGDE